MTGSIDLDLHFDPLDHEIWCERVEGERKGTIESLTTALEGVGEIRPLYAAEHAQTALGRPGAPPFLRGALADPTWRTVHAAEGPNAQAVLASADRAREGGADAVYLSPAAFSTLDPTSLREIGLPLIADPGAEALAWLGALREVEHAELRYDPLGVLARAGRLPHGRERAARLLAELAGRGRRVLVDATAYHHAGANAADEIGFALATGVLYLRWLSERGHALADAPKRLVFAFACDADVFVGIAKLRAARFAWSKVLRATGIDEDAHGMRIHAFGSKRALTKLDPLVGVLRSTSAGIAAIVGGAQDVTLPPHEPGEAAERLARNTQHLLRDESHFGQVADPAGGAYYIEALTEQIARRAWATLQAIEGAGGMLDALLAGFVQRRLGASAEGRRAALAKRTAGLVGVSRYPSLEAPSAETTPSLGPERASAETDPGVRPQRAPKSLRDAFADAPRGALSSAVEASDVDPRILGAELSRGDDELTCQALEVGYDAEPFEALRARAAALPEEQRRALVLGVGEVRKINPQAGFAREALLVAGLDVGPTDLHATMPVLTSAEVPPTVAVCTSEPLEPIIEKLRELGAVQVLAVGAVPESGEAEVDGRLERGMHAIERLGAVLARLEAS